MRFLFALAILFGSMCSAQTLTAEEVLNKSIAFHDPDGQWDTFKGAFQIRLEMPNSNDRFSHIQIDFNKQLFKLKEQTDGTTSTFTFQGDTCTTSLNGSTEISEEDRKTHKLNCERGKVMQNYYTYLYGLPMKLKDPGTMLDKTIRKKSFKGKEYLVLKVNYEKGVGDDVWYFYFDPETYAMEVYQFYHEESKGDGEYILLKDLENVNGVKMPKTRAWYYNKDDKYLGTDILIGSKGK